MRSSSTESCVQVFHYLRHSEGSCEGLVLRVTVGNVAQFGSKLRNIADSDAEPIGGLVRLY